MEWLRAWADIAGSVGWLVIMVLPTIWLYEAARQLALGKRTRGVIGMLVGGVLVVAGLGAVSLYVGNMMKDVSAHVFLPAPEELADDWGATRAPEEREKESRSRASTAYLSSGKLIRYFDRSVGWKQYCPTDEDIGLRDAAVATKTRLEETASDGRDGGLKWFGAGLMAALIGWGIGREEKRKNPSMH